MIGDDVHRGASMGWRWLARASVGRSEGGDGRSGLCGAVARRRPGHSRPAHPRPALQPPGRCRRPGPARAADVVAAARVATPSGPVPANGPAAYHCPARDDTRADDHHAPPAAAADPTAERRVVAGDGHDHRPTRNQARRWHQHRARPVAHHPSGRTIRRGDFERCGTGHARAGVRAERPRPRSGAGRARDGRRRRVQNGRRVGRRLPPDACPGVPATASEGARPCTGRNARLLGARRRGGAERGGPKAGAGCGCRRGGAERDGPKAGAGDGASRLGDGPPA